MEPPSPRPLSASEKGCHSEPTSSWIASDKGWQSERTQDVSKSARATTVSCAVNLRGSNLSGAGLFSHGVNSKSGAVSFRDQSSKTPGQAPKTMASRILTVLSGMDPEGDKEEQEIAAEIKRHERHTHAEACGSIGTAALGAAEKLEAEAREEGRHWSACVSGRCRLVASSRCFACFINVMIILSAIQMGVQADKRGGDTGRLLGEISEQVFTLVFFLEMVLQVFTMRIEYFQNGGRVLDFVIVWTSVASAWVLPFVGRTFGVLKLVKIFRLLRLFRILRLLKKIDELRMVLDGLVSSLKALFWVLALLFIVIYAFSIVCVEIVGSPDAGFPGYESDWVVIRSGRTYQTFNNYEYFGDIQRAVLTCLSFAFLVEWDAIRPVWEYQRIAIPFIICLIFVSSFGIVNVIIGVICQSTTSSMQQEKAGKQKKERLAMLQTIEGLMEVVWQADEDHDGVITKDEMHSATANVQILDALRQVGLPKGFTFDDFHTMLNLDGQAGLSQTEFFDGMHRLIFSTDFQKSCLVQLSIGQVKQLTQQLSELTNTHMLAEFKRIRRQNLKMKAELLAEMRGRPRHSRRGREKRQQDGLAPDESSSSAHSEYDDSDGSSQASAERMMTVGGASGTSGASDVSGGAPGTLGALGASTSLPKRRGRRGRPPAKVRQDFPLDQDRAFEQVPNSAVEPAWGSCVLSPSPEKEYTVRESAAEDVSPQVLTCDCAPVIPWSTPQQKSDGKASSGRVDGPTLDVSADRLIMF